MRFWEDFSYKKLIISLGTTIIVVSTIVVLSPRVIFAQTTDSTSTSTDSSNIATERAQLQAQLNTLDTQIDETQATLTTLGTQGKTLQNQIDTLTAQIKKAQLQLQATQIEIQALASNIVVHGNTINTLSGQLTDEQQSLAQIIRQTNEIDSYSLVEVALSSEDISTFFGDIDSFNAINQELNSSYNQITDTRSQTEDEKNQLQDQQTEQEQLEQEENLEEQQIQSSEAAKQQLLSENQSQTATVQAVYTTQKQSIAQIQAELFALAGGSTNISLPDAIALAKTAGADTGVDPALILGILKQETDIGQNVGVTGSWVTDMSPTRDQPVFKVIMATLGLDPNTVKVSKAQGDGWGGAMGPAQFIPSTWACYAGYINVTTGSCGKGTDGTYLGPWQYDPSQDRIAKLAGHPGTPSDPWNNTDAFVAVGMLMSDNGAIIGNLASEREAALRYYAGWGGADDPAYSFYGDDVMAFTAQFESDIQTLGNQ